MSVSRNLTDADTCMRMHLQHAGTLNVRTCTACAATSAAVRCALVAAAFQQTQPATLLQPVSVSGSMPPGPEAAVQVCAPTKYTFWATFGPFKEDECGSRQVRT